MDTINLDIKKIESDYFTHHTTGVDRVYQEIPTDQPCEYTRDKDTLDNDKIAYRIEGDLLDPFKHNPYTHSLHPLLPINSFIDIYIWLHGIKHSV